MIDLTNPACVLRASGVVDLIYNHSYSAKLQILICRRGEMRKGSALDPPKNFLKKVLRNLKNFRKRVIFHQFSPIKR